MEYKRQSIRLRSVDYANSGSYFVTVNSYERDPIFGDVENGGSALYAAGGMVQEIWNLLPRRFTWLRLGVSVVMPDHFHGILHLGDPERENLQRPFRAGAVAEGVSMRPGTLGQIMAYFKYVSTREINRLRHMPGEKVWQRNYFDKIIRDEAELRAVENYIRNNPARWEAARVPSR